MLASLTSARLATCDRCCCNLKPHDKFSSPARHDQHETRAMNFFLTIVLDGLIQASWLFIVALGLTLVFGVLKILNIAHGSFYALGAYIAATAVTLVAAHGLPPSVGFAAMLVSVALIASAVGLLLERGLLKMFYGRDEVVLLLVTYAVFLILEDVTKLIWGVNPIYATQPYELFGNVEFAGLYYVGYDLGLLPIPPPSVLRSGSALTAP